MQGESVGCLRACAEAFRATHLFRHRRYEPAWMEKDRAVEKALRPLLKVTDLPGNLLSEPGQTIKADGSPYRVFTPFWTALQKTPPAGPPLPPPDSLPRPVSTKLNTLPIDALRLLPRLAWADAFAEHWTPGEAGAWERLGLFGAQSLTDYATLRDRPDRRGTSRLSPHLHFGEISPRQIWFWLLGRPGAASDPVCSAAVDAFFRELAWREFAHHLLFHFPHTADTPLDRRFDGFPWRNDARALACWCEGATGIPIVDAGMRELRSTGWMHNRVRMIVASLLTKNLRIHWLEGARWFWDCLVDADLANNTLGWQWTAGCGADAAPYFRIFNPVRQSERFDPDGTYIRRWVPELQRLPAKWIRQPWVAPASALRAAGVTLDRGYPSPILDLNETRRQALAAWDGIKGKGKA
jgi:deoxyribodipyrimidine photo-lyase